MKMQLDWLALNVDMCVSALEKDNWGGPKYVRGNLSPETIAALFEEAIKSYISNKNYVVEVHYDEKGVNFTIGR